MGNECKFPHTIFSGYWGGCHCQGVGIDVRKGYVYFSFTTLLVKTDLDGNLIGSVTGLMGHLGCIDFCEADGKVYGSLEFKNDSIGKGIRDKLGVDTQWEDAFYCAIFDVDKITRPDMDAEKDGVMRAVYLSDVVEDFNASVLVGGKEGKRRYGCSGIDGTGWGPKIGSDGDMRLYICAGVYGDGSRDDNDYQVLYRFDAKNWWDTVARPLNQADMHRSGTRCEARNFLFTGNTTWGVQNLEYDAYTGNWIVCVYKGAKPQYPNFDQFILDGKTPPKTTVHKGTGEEIQEVFLLQEGLCENGVYGNRFPYGSTGVYAFGDGRYYFSRHACDEQKGQYTVLTLYRATGDPQNPYEEEKESLT